MSEKWNFVRSIINCRRLKVILWNLSDILQEFDSLILVDLKILRQWNIKVVLNEVEKIQKAYCLTTNLIKWKFLVFTDHSYFLDFWYFEVTINFLGFLICTSLIGLDGCNRYFDFEKIFNFWKVETNVFQIRFFLRFVVNVASFRIGIFRDKFDIPIFKIFVKSKRINLFEDVFIIIGFSGLIRG